MRTIGDRLAIFDNSDSTIKTFNSIFDEVPLLGYNSTDIVLIGEITTNSTTRMITINNIASEHNFTRRSTNETFIDNTNDTDPDWLFYFV